VPSSNDAQTCCREVRMHSEMRGVVWTALRLFVARRRGSAAAKLGDVLLFLLGRFQNLQG
jgi:hypothetical protein